MNSFDFIGKLIGKQKAVWISIFILGVTSATSIVIGAIRFYPVYIASPEMVQKEIQSLQEKQDKANTGFQIQLNEATMRTLNDQIFQLKKLKIKKMADDIDLEQLEEYKKQYDSIKSETDSLKKTLYKPK